MAGMEMNYKNGQGCRQCEASGQGVFLDSSRRQETRQSS